MFEVNGNHAIFACFLPLKLFGEGPKSLDMIFKAQPTADHGAEFCGDQSMELWATTVKQKKTSALKHKSASKAISSRWTNYLNHTAVHKYVIKMMQGHRAIKHCAYNTAYTSYMTQEKFNLSSFVLKDSLAIFQCHLLILLAVLLAEWGSHKKRKASISNFCSTNFKIVINSLMHWNFNQCTYWTALETKLYRQFVFMQTPPDDLHFLSHAVKASFSWPQDLWKLLK